MTEVVGTKALTIVEHHPLKAFFGIEVTSLGTVIPVFELNNKMRSRYKGDNRWVEIQEGLGRKLWRRISYGCSRLVVSFESWDFISSKN